MFLDSRMIESVNSSLADRMIGNAFLFPTPSCQDLVFISVFGVKVKFQSWVVETINWLPFQIVAVPGDSFVQPIMPFEDGIFILILCKEVDFQIWMIESVNW